MASGLTDDVQKQVFKVTVTGLSNLDGERADSHLFPPQNGSR